jgi:hypothetical protein
MQDSPPAAGDSFCGGITRAILALALQAIGCADVRSGILPPQSNPLRRSDPAQVHDVKQSGPHKAARFA